MTTTERLSRRIYTRDALQNTINAFANICGARYTEEPDAFALQITAPQEQLCDEFLNYVLGLSAQELLR